MVSRVKGVAGDCRGPGEGFCSLGVARIIPGGGEVLGGSEISLCGRVFVDGEWLYSGSLGWGSSFSLDS